jgi:hypothetical protein
VRAHLVIQMVDLPPDRFQAQMIVHVERVVALRFQRAQLRLDRRLVDSVHLVVHARLDPQRPAERRQQVILVHLRGSLDRVLGDLAELRDRHPFQLIVGVGHGASCQAGERCGLECRMPNVECRKYRSSFRQAGYYRI